MVTCFATVSVSLASMLISGVPWGQASGPKAGFESDAPAGPRITPEVLPTPEPGCPMAVEALARLSVRVVDLLKKDAEGPSKHDQQESKRPTETGCFTLPAHFPLPQFGPGGDPHPEIGLIIHEGMQFEVTEGNTYRVRFVASAPAVPVVLRLQFQVFANCQGNAAENQFPRLVTLPPIQIPQTIKGGSLPASTYLVECEGFFPHGGCIQRVSRSGTARFGFGASLDAEANWTSASVSQPSALAAVMPTDPCGRQQPTR